MTRGRLVAGQCIITRALYLEIIAGSISILQSDADKMELVPTIGDLAIEHTIGQNTISEITFISKPLDPAHCFSSFAMTKKADAQQYCRSSAQSTGIVHLKRRDDAPAARSFRRYQSLIGYRRYEQRLSHPNAEKMQGKHLYRAVSSIIQSLEAFRGLKEVAYIEGEAAARVLMQPCEGTSIRQILYDTPVIDSLLQIAEFFISYSSNAHFDDEAFNTHIMHAEISGSFDPTATELMVSR
jgi:ribosomal protein S26